MTTWNPSDKGSNVTLSGGNLTASIAASQADSVRSTTNVATGKAFFDTTISGSANFGVGVGNASASTTVYLGSSVNGIAYRANGDVLYNASIVATYNTYTSGDVIGVAVDADARTVSFYKNGVLEGTRSTIPTGNLYAMCGGDGAGGAGVGTANFGATAFTYAVPGGYTGWDLVPNLAYGDGNTLPVHAMTAGMDGVTASLPPHTLSAAIIFDYADNTLPAYTLEAEGGPPHYGDNELPPHTLEADLTNYGYNYAELTCPIYEILAEADVGNAMSLSAVLPAHELLADFGLMMSETLPTHTLTATAVSGTVGSLSATLPSYALVATASATTLINAALSLPVYVMSGEIVSGNTGSVILAIPTHTLGASGVTGNTAVGDNTLPIYTLVGTGYEAYTLTAELTLPAWQLSATASQAITESFRTWVLNLHKKVLTEYRNFNFNSFAVCGGRVFAAGPDGVFELTDADTDAGTAISARARTGKHNLGTTFAKRVPRLYLGYSSTGPMEVSTITPADGERAYLLPWNQATEPQLRRVPIGRGPKAPYWQFEVRNREGSNFAANGLFIYPEKSARRVGG